MPQLNGTKMWTRQALGIGRGNAHLHNHFKHYFDLVTKPHNLTLPVKDQNVEQFPPEITTFQKEISFQLQFTGNSKVTRME